MKHAMIALVALVALVLTGGAGDAQQKTQFAPLAARIAGTNPDLIKLNQKLQRANSDCQEKGFVQGSTAWTKCYHAALDEQAHQGEWGQKAKDAYDRGERQ